MPSPRPQQRDGISSWAETELRQSYLGVPGLESSGADTTPRSWRSQRGLTTRECWRRESKKRWRGASLGGRVRIALSMMSMSRTERKKAQASNDSRKLKRRSAGGGRQTRGCWEPIAKTNPVGLTVPRKLARPGCRRGLAPWRRLGMRSAKSPALPVFFFLSQVSSPLHTTHRPLERDKVAVPGTARADPVRYVRNGQ